MDRNQRKDKFDETGVDSLIASARAADAGPKNSSFHVNVRSERLSLSETAIHSAGEGWERPYSFHCKFH